MQSRLQWSDFHYLIFSAINLLYFESFSGVILSTHKNIRNKGSYKERPDLHVAGPGYSALFCGIGFSILTSYSSFQYFQHFLAELVFFFFKNITIFHIFHDL